MLGCWSKWGFYGVDGSEWVQREGHFFLFGENSKVKISFYVWCAFPVHFTIRKFGQIGQKWSNYGLNAIKMGMVHCLEASQTVTQYLGWVPTDSGIEG